MGRSGVVVSTLAQRSKHTQDMTGSTPVAGCHTTHHRVAALGKLFTLMASAEISCHLLIRDCIVCIV